MTADEFRKMLDRFHEAIGGLDAEPISPNRLRELDRIWRDLSRECALMKDAEQRLPAPPESVRGSATEANAHEIGKLQAKVARLEGYVKATDREQLELLGKMRFQLDTHVKLQKTVMGIQDRELARQQDRIDATDGSVPE